MLAGTVGHMGYVAMHVHQYMCDASQRQAHACMPVSCLMVQQASRVAATADASLLDRGSPPCHLAPSPFPHTGSCGPPVLSPAAHYLGIGCLLHLGPPPKHRVY